ncbi:hypothetical protein ES705_20793 [subsurface metagenome]
MLNSGGGMIYIGIGNESDKGEGVNNPKEFEKRLRDELLSSQDIYKPALSPQAYWSIESKMYNKRKIMIISVPAGAFLPYAIDGEIYIRKNNQTLQAESNEVDYLINQRYLEFSRWGTLPVLEKEIKDLDKDLILETAKIAEEKHLFKFSDLSDPFSILDNLNLIFQGRISNFAFLLFGKNPERTYPQIRARIVTYLGKKTDLKIGTDKFFEGNLLKQYHLVTDYIRNQIPTISELTAFDDVRKDELKYPYWSIREGVRNAIIHRNYATSTAEMKIEIFPDRISIWSYGLLPEKLKISDLKKEHPSLPPNPEIAQIFFLRGIIEKLGRGTQRITEEFKDAGLPSPKWEEIVGGIKLTMTGKRVGKDVPEVFNARQIEAIKKVNTGDVVRVKDYLELINVKIAPRTARDDIYGLVKEGYFKQQGKGQSTVYIRTDKR